MSARTIVTSQPDVACDVCTRRLLRGEQPDVFLADGERRIVCELCAPRATHAGWLRESESLALALPAARPRRARSMFARLPAPFRVRQATRAPGEVGEVGEVGDAAAIAAMQAREPEPLRAPSSDTAEPRTEARAEELGGRREGHEHPEGHRQAFVGSASDRDAGGEEPRSYAHEAVHVFNASVYPRRVAGLIRSLGAPLVSVRSAEHLASVVRIVIFWELCWYRYEVDLSEAAAEVHVLVQGRELAELPREERRANARVRSSGELELDRVGAREAPVAEHV